MVLACLGEQVGERVAGLDPGHAVVALAALQVEVVVVLGDVQDVRGVRVRGVLEVAGVLLRLGEERA